MLVPSGLGPGLSENNVHLQAHCVISRLGCWPSDQEELLQQTRRQQELAALSALLWLQS